MGKINWKLWIFSFICFSCLVSNADTNVVCREQNRIVVTAQSHNHFKADLELYLRGQLKMSIPVNIGRNGIGWHRPLIEDIDMALIPEKQEGDGKTPLGKYLLKTEFGFAEQGQTEFKYQKLSQNIECVDDVQSVYYNQIIDVTKVHKQDWNSSEKMAKILEYEYGFNIEYPSQRDNKQGSCLFVHTLLNPLKGTAGCIAMSVQQLLIMNQFLNDAQLQAIPIFILTKKGACPSSTM